MKRNCILVLPLALALVAVLGLSVNVARADNGPHGGYTPTTDACAGCHRAHTGVGDPLLKASTSYALCISCHDGTGANTDVQDGKWMPNSASLKGGGFVNATMNANLTTVVTTTTTSGHKVNGMSGYAGDTIWGIGVLNSGAGTSFTLECFTCHDPHGKSGTSGQATYRILRNQPYNVSGLGTPVTVSDVITKSYTLNTATNAFTTTVGVYYGTKYSGTTSDLDNDNGKVATITNWCASCHTRIHATTFNSSSDAIYNYRHRTDGSNVSGSDSSGFPACLTCHVAHGTIAAMGTYSSAVAKPNGSGNLDSSLLRIDNRGVCESCHNK